MGDPNKVLFSSEFEGSGLNQGVDATIDKLAEMSIEINAVKKQTQEYNVEIEKNEVSIKKLSSALAIASKSKKDNSIQTKALVKDITSLNSTNKELTKNVLLNQEKIISSSKSLKEYRNEVFQTTRTHNQASNALEKFHDANALTAEALNHVRRQFVDLSLGIVTGFVGAIIGAAIPALIAMIAKAAEASEQQKILNTVLEESNKAVAPDIATLELYKQKLNDLSIPQRERIKIATEYNKIADDGNQIDLKQINNLDLINSKIQQQIRLLKERAIAKAAENILAEKEETLLNAQLRFAQAESQNQFGSAQSLTAQLDKARNAIKQVVGDKKFNIKELIAFYDIPEEDLKHLAATNKNVALLQDLRIKRILDKEVPLIKAIQASHSRVQESLAGFDVEEAKKDFDKTLETVGKLVTTAGLSTDDKGKAEKKAPENVFKEKLLELKAKLAATTISVFKSEGLIRNEFSVQLDKEFGAIDKLLREKKLTAPQADILKGFLVKINSAELAKSLDEFKKKRVEAEQAINDEIQKVQLEGATERINNLRDEFEKERLTIDQSYSKTVELLTKRLRDTLKKLDEDVKSGLLSKEAGDKKGKLITLLFGDLFEQTGIEQTNRQLDLAFKIFEQTIKDGQETLSSDTLRLSEETGSHISNLTKQYLSGAINYTKFQKELTKALEKEAAARRELRRLELDDELKKVNAEILANNDPELNKKLLAQQKVIRTEQEALSRETDAARATDKQKKGDERIGTLIKYANAIGELTNEVIGFWQKVNEVEQKQIERSIALQEKRVTAAQRIADRGNAEYLRQEEDRLVQLQIKQENAAKKQLAINAVLTASQALVAFISAIAQGAKIGGALGAIVDAAAIIALLGTGYSIVKSLQSNAPKLFTGTKSVERGGAPAGRDTVAAWLNEGEAVIPTATNKQYKPAIDAIYDKAIPPEILNNFVKGYPGVRIPGLNYQSIGEGAEMRISGEGKLVAIITEQNQQLRANNEIMRSMDNRLKHFGVNVNMDEHGFAMSILEAAEKHKISSKA